MLLWSSAHQLDYIPASPTLGCKSPPSRGARLTVSKVRRVHTKTRRATPWSSSWRGKGEVPREFRQLPFVVSLLCNCEPSLKECQGRVAGSGSCTTAACPCLELVQSIRHWLREETSSTHWGRVLPRSWTRSRAPDSLSQSLSKSGLDPSVLEATGSGREKQQRQNTLTCLDVIQHAGFFLNC